MPSPQTTTALRSAIEPLAAYVARTPAGNRHADTVAAAVDAVADYVEEVEAENEVPPGPDWEHIAHRFLAYLEPEKPPTPAMIRARRQLDYLAARAARPLAERMALASLNSHYLGCPATL